MRSCCLADVRRVSRGVRCDVTRSERSDAGTSRGMRSFTSFRRTTVGHFGGKTARVMCGFVGLLVVALPVAPAVGADAAPAPVDAEPALSWRLDSISSDLLGPSQPPAAWRRSAALLEAAGRLNPSEPRFPRLQVLALLHVGDSDGAIAALRAYRKLVPADRQAQAQLIDLYAGKMETVDAKLAYFQTLLDKAEIPG